ncbi:MAG: YidC/Oxa1 family membrane protein insertase [Deltaproteobacteria bacterium]
MSTLFGTIAHALGFILHILYNLVWFNYGIAIVILTVIIRFLLLPFAIKSFKSMAQMSEIQPLVNELQRKYKNDKETLNKELMQLYQERKINPLGGCMPLLINFLILYSLFLVMTSPITYMFNVQEITQTNTFVSHVTQGNYYKEVEFLEKLQKKPDIYKQLISEIGKKADGKQIIERIVARNVAYMNLKFLGINLGDVPKFIPPQQERQKYIILWIIPILACATTYLASKHGQMPTNNTEMTDMQKSMQTQMFIMMPLMTLYFSFLVPVALSVYWILGNVLQLIQQKALINIYVTKKEVI